MLELEIFWTSAFGKPADDITSETWFSDTGLMNAVWMREPDLKLMPKFSPLPPIASAPISRIVPDSVKNHLERPMKSNFQPFPRRSAPSAQGWEISRERPSVPSA